MPTSYNDTSEEAIVERIKQGDNGGYDVLYDHYSALLFGIIKRIVNNDHDTENLLQDCFVKIWLNIHSFEPSKGKLATWLINIARNTAIDFTRSKIFSQRLKNQSIENIVSPSIEISTPSVPAETIGLRQIVDTLPPQCREIIEWMYFEGYTQQEISENFNIPLGTVKTRARMALQELRLYFDVT